MSTQGPLLNLRMFQHPSLLRWCTMHTLNLGMVFSANGGSLILNYLSLMSSCVLYVVSLCFVCDPCKPSVGLFALCVGPVIKSGFC